MAVSTIQTSRLAGKAQTICFSCRNSSSSNITGSASTMDLSVVVEADNNVSLASNEITFNASGTGMISYTLPVNDDGTAGASRGQLRAYLEVDTGSGYSIINTSISATYHRESSGGSGVSAACALTWSAGDKVRLRALCSPTPDVSQENETDKYTGLSIFGLII